MAYINIDLSDLGLLPKQKQAVYLRAAGKSWREIASEIDVSDRTIETYASNPRVKTAVNRLLDEIFEQTIAILVSESVTAAHKLGDLVKGEKPQALEFPASKALLDLVFRARSNMDYERRLLQLEEQLANKNESKVDNYDLLLEKARAEVNDEA